MALLRASTWDPGIKERSVMGSRRVQLLTAVQRRDISWVQDVLKQVNL